MEYFHHAEKYPNELTPTILENGRITQLRVNKFTAQCYQDTGVLFDKRSSGWRPLVVNENEGGSKKSNHIQAKAEDKIDDEERLLARYMLSKRGQDLLAACGLWCEDPRWCAEFAPNERHEGIDGQDKTGTWHYWVHFQIVPPGSGKRVYVPYNSKPITPPLKPWKPDGLTFEKTGYV